MRSEIHELKALVAKQQQQLAEKEQKIQSLEASLIKSNTYLKSMLDKTAENIYWMDKEGRILLCNEQQAHFFGLKDSNELIGKNIYDVAKMLNWDRELADKIRRNDVEIVTTQQEYTIQEEVLIKGKKYIVRSSKSPFYDSNDNLIGIFGISNDITNLKKMEQELRLANQEANSDKAKYRVYLDNILANIPEHLYWMDTDGCIIGCNDKQAKSFGLADANQLIGKNIYDVGDMLGWDKGIADKIRQNDLEIMTKRQRKIDEEVVFLDGEYRTFLSYKNPLMASDNSVIGVFGIAIDITERKQLELELVKTKEQTEVAFMLLQASTLLELVTRVQNKRLKLDVLGKSLILSPRETETLLRLFKSNTAKEIARAMNLSFRTIEDYITSLKNKFGCCTRAELVKIAFDSGFLNLFVKEVT